MDVYSALSSRKSVRAFLDKPVDKSIIKRILKGAGLAPSGVNTQPWEVVVLSGSSKSHLGKQIEEAFRSNVKPNADYDYYPDVWLEPYKARRKDCGLRLYTALEIERSDRQRQQDQWAANYRAFDAPVMLLFFIRNEMNEGSFMDYGMFLQSLMLAAVVEGLSTCPQAALAQYPDIVRGSLNIGDDRLLLAGMALGYEDIEDPVNSYRTDRVSVDQFTTYLMDE